MFHSPQTTEKAFFCCWFMQVLVNTCNLSLHKLYWSYYCQGEMKRDASIPWLEAKTPPGWEHTIPNLHRARILGFGPTNQCKACPLLLESVRGGGIGAVPCLPTASSAPKWGPGGQCPPETGVTGARGPPLPIAFSSHIHNWAVAQCSPGGKRMRDQHIHLHGHTLLADLGCTPEWLHAEMGVIITPHPPFKIIPAELMLSSDKRLWFTQEHVTCSCKWDV